VAQSQRAPRGRPEVLLLCGGSVLAAAAFEFVGSDAFRFLLGEYSPALVAIAVSVVGVLSLEASARRGWLHYAAPGRPRLRMLVGLGAALTVPVIVVDWLGGFPPGINVRWPSALLLYPVVAVMAELVFHACPVGIAAVSWPKGSPAADRVGLFVALAVAALIEPSFQVLWVLGQSPPWANAYVGFHLLVFNIVALQVFRLRGFLAAYLFRLSYYVVWHILWGHARLGLLFGGET